MALCQCNVAEPPLSSGGVDFGRDAGAGGQLEDSPGGHGQDAPDSTDDAGVSRRECDRGVVIVESDYKSTNIVVSNLDGTTLSGSFVSSAATKPGLTLALSGDVDVPFVAPASKRLVLIDRFGTNVLTWMKVDTADVLAQLPIGQGFESNPYDYIEVDATRAFVSRYGTNMTPGARPFDEGGDLLIVDTTTPAILGRIAMPEENPQLQPCPAQMNWVGAEIAVTLDRWSADFSMAGEGRFVGVSPQMNSVVWTVDVPGLEACGRVAVSPNGKRLAIACSGRYDVATKRFDESRSDIVLFDASTSPPTEIKRFGAASRLDAGIQPRLVFADDNLILATAYGGNGSAGDRAFALDITSGTFTLLASATKAYVFGGLRCEPGCGDVCLMSDAEINRLRRWRVSPSGLFEPLADIVPEIIIGLPPRSIGGI
jgi:hypothetical protein